MANTLLMAKTAAEAIAAKTASAAFLAGGTEVNRLGSSVEAETLISLKKCEGLDSIKKVGNMVEIGSMCTFQEIVESQDVPAYMKEAALFMASRTKRNMATIGGNVAAHRSDSYLLPALCAADAEVSMLAGDLEKKINVNAYINEENADSLITGITVPAGIKVVSKRYANTAQSHAVITMSAASTSRGIKLAVAIKNVGILSFNLSSSGKLTEEAAVAYFKTVELKGIEDDMFGSVDYKRYLLGITAYDLCKQLTAGSGKEV